MHYCCYVITRVFPSDDAIGEMLEPFHEEHEDRGEGERPPFEWDWWEVGGRYNGKFKLKVDKDDEQVYQWKYALPTPRAGRLFRSYALEEGRAAALSTKPAFMYEEEKFLNSMGMREGFIYCDGAPMADIINIEEQAVECYCLVDADGAGYSREHWNGEDWVVNDQFDEQCRKIVSERKDCYITVVDLHD